jgi:dTDP-4-dehydrorhamnose reductase
MRVLVLGGTGMLGHKLVQELRPDFDTWATINGPLQGSSAYAHLEIDKTIPFVDGLNFTTVEAAIRAVSPDVVVNAVGVIKQLPTSKDVVVTLSLNTILVD